MSRVSVGVVRLFLIVLTGALFGGCAMTAPQYSASIDNVQKLKDASVSPAKVGTFLSKQEAGNENPISLRGNKMSSPYGDSYANYLSEALKQELSLAGKLSAGAETEVTGVLLKNNLDAAIGTGMGDIRARINVKRSGQLVYDKEKAAHAEWESSFIGATAIPKAQQAYVPLVQKLLSELYADPDFLKALR